jgi:hypothetical protein
MTSSKKQSNKIFRDILIGVIIPIIMLLSACQTKKTGEKTVADNSPSKLNQSKFLFHPLQLFTK